MSIQIVLWQTLFRARRGILQASLDRLFLPAQTAPPTEGEKKTIPVWAAILIVLAAGAALFLCLNVCIIALLTALGSSINDVFSNIVQDMQTP